MNDDRLIENLIYTYAELIDAGQLEAVAELFREAEVHAPEVGGKPSVGFDAVLHTYRAATRIYPDTGTPKTRHLTTNVIVEVEGEQARARSCYTVLQATDELPLQAIIAGRYHDEFKKVDGQWRFSKRNMFVDMLGDCSAHLLYGTEGLQPDSG